MQSQTTNQGLTGRFVGLKPYISGFGALLALGISFAAYLESRTTNRLAAAAHRISVEAINKASESNCIAEKSNTIAARANQIAENSVELASRPEVYPFEPIVEYDKTRVRLNIAVNNWSPNSAMIVTAEATLANEGTVYMKVDMLKNAAVGPNGTTRDEFYTDRFPMIEGHKIDLVPLFERLRLALDLSYVSIQYPERVWKLPVHVTTTMIDRTIVGLPRPANQ